MENTRTLNALVLSIYRDLAEDFLGGLTADPKQEVTLDSCRVAFDIVAGDPAQDPMFAEHLARAGAIILVVRFLDVLSLEKIKNIYRSLPDAPGVPIAIFMLRDKGESDFKISCPACGQKLWLRDSDVGKRGRCPNCTKPFVILSQGDHLKTQLMLPDKVAIHTVTRTQPEMLQAALTRVLRNAASALNPADRSVNEEALKNATVRIQIQPP